MTDAPVLSVRNIGLSFGRTQVLSDVRLDIEGGERHAIIGPSGAGKSSLLRVLSGMGAPDEGVVLVATLREAQQVFCNIDAGIGKELMEE